MKRKGLRYASIKSFRLGAKLVPKPFIGYVIFSLFGGILSIATIGSFSVLVNKTVSIINNSGFQNFSLLEITNTLLPYIVLLLLSFLIPPLINTGGSYFGNVFGELFMTRIQDLFVKKQASLDAATLESPEYQDKIQQGNEWGRGSIATVISRNLYAVNRLGSVVVTFIVLIAIDIRLAILAVVSSIPLYYIEQKFNRTLFRTRRLYTPSKRIISNRLSLFQSQYSLIELNMFGSSSKFVDELYENLSEEDRLILNIQRKKNITQIFFQVYTTIFSVIAGLLVLQKGFSGLLPIGSMLLAFSAYSSFYSSMNGLFVEMALAQDASRYAIMWFDIFDTKPLISSKEKAFTPVYQDSPEIEFKNVSFKYSDSESLSLEDINLVIKPYEKLAIVGLSGAGKTTLIKLLCRVYDPTEGTILIDGIDLKDIDISTWHNYLAVMFQNYGQYSVTVEESVALGKNGKIVDKEKVSWALEMAGAKGFVEKLKNGTKQLLWKGFKGGTDLSKGEHQRIAIARIFYRDTLISVLDEPTSSVDALTAQMIFSNLENKMERKTVILISHNFSTVKEASNIVVLENGKIIEQGTHEKLYFKNGRYAELYSSQANAFEKVN